MDLDEVKLTLENESGFYHGYTAIKNQPSKSIGPQRRNFIKEYVYAHFSRSPSMLEQLALEMYFNDRYELCPYGLSNKPFNPSTQKEENMNDKYKDDCHSGQISQMAKSKSESSDVKTIETITYINGTPAGHMSDDQIFAAIAKIENEINTLEGIHAKPKKLEAKITTMKKDIEALVALVDTRP